MNDREFLAKWRDQDGDDPSKWGWPRGKTIMEHTRECIAMALFILDDKVAAIGQSFYSTMNLSEYVTYAEFRRICIISVLLHDIGKANSEFQKMLDMLEAKWHDCLRLNLDGKTTRGRLKADRVHQAMRHEMAGLLFLAGAKQGPWLTAQVGHFKRIVLGAIFGHHIKTHRQIAKELAENPTLDVKICISAKPIVDMVRSLIHEFKLDFEPMPECGDMDLGVLDSHNELEPFLRNKPEDPNWQAENRLSMAVKFVTILADTFGSMSPRKGWSTGHAGFTEWLKNHIRSGLKNKVCHLRNKISLKARTKPYPHQVEALNMAGSALVDVSCGGGKTDTGLLGVSDTSEYTSTKRTLMLLPVRAAALQLFRDGALTRTEKGKFKAKKGAALRTGTSVTDCVLLQLNGDEEDEEDDAPRDILEVLDQYGEEIIYATVDQLLGVVSYRRKAILWLPLIVKSRGIFDEFHVYDNIMVHNFNQFLKIFPNTDAIAMSATVTAEQETDFQAMRPGATIIHSSGGVDDLSRYPRYRFHIISENEAMDLFTIKNRTLWVVNRVAVCQGIGRQALNSHVLHSIYRHKGRLLAQEDLVNSFRSQRLTRAVTTQIAQLSFNISAGRLITEWCPPDDFVQRTGRAGERGKIPKGLTDIFCYLPETSRPYTVDLAALAPWYKVLEDKETWSLHELVTYFKETRPPVIKTEPDLFERSMMQTYPMMVRQINGKITALLESDIPEIEHRLETEGYNTRIIQEYDFSVFQRKEFRQLKEFHHRIVVPYKYDERLGVISQDLSQKPGDEE